MTLNLPSGDHPRARPRFLLFVLPIFHPSLLDRIDNYLHETRSILSTQTLPGGWGCGIRLLASRDSGGIGGAQRSCRDLVFIGILNCLQCNFYQSIMHFMATTSAPRRAINMDQALMLENQLCFAMYAASLAMTKVYKKLLQPLDITYPQYLVMLVLWEKDQVMVSELGSKLFLDSGTLTPLLKRMEAMGLLRRRRDAADERRVLVHLSAEGRALCKRAAAVPATLMCALPPLEQVVNLREQLKDLRTGLLAETGHSASSVESGQ